MLVISRALGQSIVICDGAIPTVTLTRVGTDAVEIGLEELWAEGKPRSATVSKHEMVEVFPGIKVAFLEHLPSCLGARLGLDVPHGVSVVRKEIWDANWGNG